MVRSRYTAIIQEVFRSRFKTGMTQVDFDRSELPAAAERVGVPCPKNVGDILYSSRYRRKLPESIQATAPEGYEWIIRGRGQSRYGFVLIQIEQDMALCESRFPDLICLPVAAQFMRDQVIALFSFEKIDGDVKVLAERHYRLVEPNELTAADLAAYQRRTDPD